MRYPQSAMKTLHDLVADKLEAVDVTGREKLLRIPLENIDRWLANGHTSPHRIEQWRQILLCAQQSPEGFQDLVIVVGPRNRVDPSDVSILMSSPLLSLRSSNAGVDTLPHLAKVSP